MRGSWLGLAVMLAATWSPTLEAQAVKIGYIDSQAILSEYDGAQSARDEMERSLASYQAEIQQMSQSLQQAMEAFQQQEMTLTAEARANRQEELQIQQQALQQRAQELDAQATRRQAEVFQPVMAEIGEVIDQIRVEGSYAMILDVASQAVIVE